jgi:hypothetical protein
MARYIDADALLSGYDVRKVVEYDESGCGLDYKAVPVGAIEAAPTIDAVSPGVLEQYKWERDTAIAQLEELGIGFGQKKPDMVEVGRCTDCRHRGIVSEGPMCYTEDSYDEDYGYDYWDVDKTVDEGFCHCGEVDAEVEG